MTQVLRVSMVYGYHGPTPLHVEDMLVYLQRLMNLAGCDLRFQNVPTIDDNDAFLFMDGFEECHFEAIKVMKSMSKKVVIIATEYLTGNTFNNFDFQHSTGANNNSNSPLPPLFRKLMTRKSEYGVAKHWKKRFEIFSKAADYADEVWVWSRDTLEDYRNLVGKKVRQIPIGYIMSLDSSNNYKNISRTTDAFFSGSSTHYRKQLLQALIDAGVSVECLPVSTPNFIRENRSAHAKICLALKQNAGWKYPSVMRHVWHLSNGHLVVRESTDFTDPLDKYLISVESGRADHFVSSIIKLLENPDISEIKKKNFDSFKTDLALTGDDAVQFLRLFRTV